MFNTIYSMSTFADRLNDYTFTDYYLRLNMLARSMFKWENLPNGINEKWIEKYLFSEGCCLFFKDETLGYMVTKTTQAGQLNHYDEPTLLQPIATNFTTSGSPLEKDIECVLICNNDCMLPTLPTIKLYAYRLAEITRTADVNITAQKTPVLITGSNRLILSLKNIYNQWKGNEPVLLADKNFDSQETMKVLKTDAPIVFDKLRLEKNHLWNECMTFIGLNNANMDKRERLVAGEVQANNAQIELSAQTMLKAREQACEEINKLFGLDIKVSLRCNPADMVKGGET